MNRILILLCYALAACARTAPLTEHASHTRYFEGVCPVSLSLDFQGVWTNPNPHSKVPSGAARRAENLINPKPGVAECVAGMETLAGTYSASDERLSSATTYDGFVIESTAGATDKLYRLDPDTLTRTAYSGSYSPPSGVERVPMAVAGEKLFLATSTGVQVMDGGTATPATIGLPQPIGARQVVLTNGGSGVFDLSAGGQVAYRWVHARDDADGVRQMSAPSGRHILTSAGGAGGPYDIRLDLNLHSEIVAGDQILVFRTGFSAVGVDPGDIMYMVLIHEVTSAEVTAAFVQLTDNTPDELRGEALYTNGTNEGISRQNERAPLAGAVLAFDDSLLAGNVTGPQRFSVRLLAPMDVGDIITIAGQTYEAKNYTDPTDPDYTAGEFEVTSGFPSVSDNIRATALALIDTINRTTTNTAVYASYASGSQDPPGIIQLERRTVTGAAFTIQASANGDRYEPPITTAQSSLATTEPNGIWVSKRGQHYAFPPLRSAGTGATYRFKVGTKGGAILAMAALRDSVIVFVEKEGVFKVRRTGAESWRSDQINNNAHLLVPGSVAVVDNQVLALTTRGLVAVDESGVEEIDLPIKDKFKAIIELGPDLLLPLSFAVGDEARLRYIFYHPLTSASTTADHAWVYNADQGTWTERTDAASGGLVSEDDGLLYLGSATSNTLTRERTGTDAQVYKRPDNTAIPVRLEWTVMDEEDPGAEKQFTEIRLLTEDAITGDVTFNCTNDLGGTESTTGSTSDNATGEPFVLAWVPDGCQRTTRLRVDIQRDVLGEAFEVVGFKALVAGMYNGGMQR
jgi:hypothetical protein